MMEEKEEIKQIEEIKEWNTCCSKTQPSFVKYISQLVVSFLILIFAFIQILRGDTSAVWISFITLIMGLYTPTPTHKK
jgi:hypothetical protein